MSCREGTAERAAFEEAAPADEVPGPTCGGASFTATTKVLLGDGKAVPISAPKPGDKILATNTKTGKTQAETVAAVLVHYDTNLYDLTVGSHGRTTVIGTTSNHPFWDATVEVLAARRSRSARP